tara:strand:+ start:3980 stop:4216 length:237 start_codon:yes stop_codon:yes gene_type:complete
MLTVPELEKVFLNEDQFTITNIAGGIDHAIVELMSHEEGFDVKVWQRESDYHYYTITSFNQNGDGHWTSWNSIMRYEK